MPTPPFKTRPFLRPNLVTMLVTSVFSSAGYFPGGAGDIGGAQGPLDSLTRHPQFEAGYLWPKAVRQWHYVLPFGPRWWPKPCEWRDGECLWMERSPTKRSCQKISHHLRRFLLRLFILCWRISEKSTLVVQNVHMLHQFAPSVASNSVVPTKTPKYRNTYC